jgi:predicted ester cyclase
VPTIRESIDRHRDAYRQVIAAVDTGDEHALDDGLAADLVDHNPIPGQLPGREGFKEWMRSARQSFPDLSASVEDVVAEGDRVAGRVRYRGTHWGSFAGIAPTGHAVEFEAFHIARLQDGKEWWGTADLLGALMQMGARLVEPGG